MEDDEGDAVLEREGQRLEAMMRAQPRTKEDDMRDELFSTSRTRAAASGEGKELFPQPTTAQYRPSEGDKELPDKASGVGSDAGESSRQEEEGGEGEGQDIN